MSIEYLKDVQVGGKIDLSRFNKDRQRPEDKFSWEKFSPFLDQELKNLAEESNQELEGFLKSDGRISLAGPDERSDQDLVDQQEIAFAGGREKLAAWRASHEKNPATLAEKSLTIALSKILGKGYLVARACEYDDYNNGVDQVIIDKETGKVLCGFDEVLSREGLAGSPKKEKKFQQSIDRGGARIKYGVALKDEQLVRAKVENIPAFYLPVSKEDLYSLLSSQQAGGAARQTAEINIFNKLLESLQSQVALLNNQANPNFGLLKNMRVVLEKLEKINQPALAA